MVNEDVIVKEQNEDVIVKEQNVVSVDDFLSTEIPVTDLITEQQIVEEFLGNPRPLRQVAADVDRSHEWVRIVLIRNGVDWKQLINNLSESDRVVQEQNILDAYRSGMNRKEIVSSLGLSGQVVGKVLQHEPKNNYGKCPRCDVLAIDQDSYPKCSTCGFNRRTVGSKAQGIAKTALVAEYRDEYKQIHKGVRAAGVSSKKSQSKSLTILVDIHHDRYDELYKAAKQSILNDRSWETNENTE